MGSVPDEAEVLPVAQAFASRGVSIHWLNRRSKAPVEAGWTTTPTQTPEQLAASYRRGCNIGLRPGEWSLTPHGYLHIVDLDVRDEAQSDDARAALAQHWPTFQQAPHVISGSGGDSRHFYFFTDKPFRGRKLAHADGFTMVFDARLQREVKKWDWEVELFGTGKQVALPPSVHDKSGENYAWGREIDWDLLDLGVGPVLDSAFVEGWGASLDTADDDDDLLALARAEPMGLTEQEIVDTLSDLPPTWVEDRDTWRDVGMALHHEYRGARAGFDRWCEWSKASAKFDAKDSAAVWKSFGKEHIRNPIRMASLIKVAGEHRLEQAHAVLDLLDDTDDLLAPSTALTVIDTTALDAEVADLLADQPAQSITPGVSGRPVLTYDPEWRSHFHRNEEGALKTTLHNVRLIMRNDARLRGVIALNEFTQEQVVLKTPGRMKLKKESPKPIVQLEGRIWALRDPINGSLWSDSHSNSVRAVIEAPERQGGYAIKPSKSDVDAAADIVAQENSFHPVRDYLNGLRWDGIPRLARLWIDYVGAPDDDYHREAALLWALGAVTRIFEPGHKFDFVPILEGIQGKRKSTFFRVMAKDWFAELEGDFHDTKGMVEKMQGAWILEIPELSGFSKAEVTIIKGFVSRQVDKVRLSYGRRATEFFRQCVFGGTTNEDEYLRDATGGRRFWPVRCSDTDIDIDRLRREVDQLWAEAVALYRQWRAEAGPKAALPLYMKNDLAVGQAKRLQEARRQSGADDALAGRIEAWLESPIGSEMGDIDALTDEPPVYRDRICLMQVWSEMMGRDINFYDEREAQKLSRAIRKIPGWTTNGDKEMFAGYGRQRAYFKI